MAPVFLNDYVSAAALKGLCKYCYDSTLVGTTCPRIRYGYEQAVVNESETRRF